MTLKVITWDVKHGSATYVNTPNGTHIVHDLGTGSYGRDKEEFSPLLYLKSNWGVDELDYVIISHPHKDHIDDIMNFDALSPDVFRTPKHISEDKIMEDVREQDEYLFEKYLDICGKYSDPVNPSDNPELPDNNGGVKIKVFCSNSCDTSNINNHSLVAVYSYAESKIIIPGDNESPSWEKLLDDDEFLEVISDADILLAPHHGRKSGFCSKLFDYFTPKLTIISDGRFCDTSATDRYSKVSSGWKVHCEKEKKEKRYCLTTRKDGVVLTKLGYNLDGTPFIEVKI